MEIVGRKEEQKELNRLYESRQSEFVAVYGRRRVGKTYLIRETFRDRITFMHTGLNIYNEETLVTTKDQLSHFLHSLQSYGCEATAQPKDWNEAFYMLEALLTKLDDGKRQVVFLDELPWLDTAGSKFLTALEAFWNGWGAARENLMLIVCGSAASWIIKNLIKNSKGLYGRLTYEMRLRPFTLSETESFLKYKNVELSRFDIVLAYMALGGIPYYLGYIRSGLSLAQNLDLILTDRNASLRLEFSILFRSLFLNHERYVDIIKYLATRHIGFTRDEIAKHINIVTGGTLSDTLTALVESDFIEVYRPFDARKSETLYRLTDPFCRMWLHFMESGKVKDPQFWQHNINASVINAWAGVAFEEVCMKHIEQIKKSLGISAIVSEASAYTLRGDESHDGAQCDLIIRRADRVVNLCEMKFVRESFTITKTEDLKLRNRMSLVRDSLKRSETLHLTMVTTFGVRKNAYSGLVQSEVTLDDLFE